MNPIENSALKPLKNKIAESELEQLTKDLDETFRAIAQEFKKLRENPIVQLFAGLSEEEAEQLVNKIKNL